MEIETLLFFLDAFITGPAAQDLRGRGAFGVGDILAQITVPAVDLPDVAAGLRFFGALITLGRVGQPGGHDAFCFWFALTKGAFRF